MTEILNFFPSVYSYKCSDVSNSHVYIIPMPKCARLEAQNIFPVASLWLNMTPTREENVFIKFLPNMLRGYHSIASVILTRQRKGKKLLNAAARIMFKLEKSKVVNGVNTFDTKTFSQTHFIMQILFVNMLLEHCDSLQQELAITLEHIYSESACCWLWEGLCAFRCEPVMRYQMLYVLNLEPHSIQVWTVYSKQNRNRFNLVILLNINSGVQMFISTWFYNTK